MPAFRVHRVTMAEVVPLARYYNCIHCDHELTDWIMKQPAAQPAECPKCGVPIDERELAQAQRDTKLGCLWTLGSIVLLFLAVAATVGVVWLFVGPQPLIRFR